MTDELAVEGSSDTKDLLILFGTETGNAEALADEAAEKANEMGFTTK
jgi:flavodoxin